MDAVRKLPSCGCSWRLSLLDAVCADFLGPTCWNTMFGGPSDFLPVDVSALEDEDGVGGGGGGAKSHGEKPV
jgi:hypothetical protein